MEIRIQSLVEGARKAKGLTILIDVFRAFTTAAYVLHNGADRILAVGDLEEAYQLKRENPEYVLMGERGGLPLPGFDYGNSPSQMARIDLSGKHVVMTTTSGTQGIVNAAGADEIVLGNFVNASCITQYVRRKDPAFVTIIPLGDSPTQKNVEDEECARYLQSLIQGEKPDFKPVRERIMKAQSAVKFLENPRFPKEDPKYCLALDAFDFYMKAGKKQCYPEIKKYSLE